MARGSIIKRGAPPGNGGGGGSDGEASLLKRRTRSPQGRTAWHSWILRPEREAQYSTGRGGGR